MIKRVFISLRYERLKDLGRGIALRIVGAIHRCASTGAGNVKAVRGLHSPEFRLRAGDWRVRFHDHGEWIDILRVRNRRDVYYRSLL